MAKVVPISLPPLAAAATAVVGVDCADEGTVALITASPLLPPAARLTFEKDDDEAEEEEKDGRGGMKSDNHQGNVMI